MTLWLTGVYSAAALVICLGYNVFYMELALPNGTKAQLLDLMDYISVSFLMPLVALLTSILIGWVLKPQWIIDELEKGGSPFRAKKIFAFMIRYVCPIVMVILFIQSTGIL